MHRTHQFEFGPGANATPARLFTSHLRRCHWLTWSTTLLVLTVLVLIVVPGEWSNARFGEGTTPWDQRCTRLYQSTYESHAKNYRSASISSGVTVFIYEHGWPHPFLARALVNKETPGGLPYRVRSTPRIQVESWFQYWGGSKYISVSWSDYDHWPFSADNWILNPWAMLLDFAVVAVIVLTAGAATQWWIHCHHGRCSFHLRDLLGVIAILGILIGIYTHHARIRRIEGVATTPLRPPGFYVRGHEMTASQSYCGPAWLRKLAGSEYFPQLFHHITHATLQTNDSWRDCYRELSKYPYMVSINIIEPLPKEAIDELKRCRSLKHLSMPPFRSDWKPSQPLVSTLGVDDLGMLGGLHLESIELSGDQILAKHVEQMAGLSTMKRITLRRISVHEGELNAIRYKHPNVKIVVERTDWDSAG